MDSHAVVLSDQTRVKQFEEVTQTITVGHPPNRMSLPLNSLAIFPSLPSGHSRHEKTKEMFRSLGLHLLRLKATFVIDQSSYEREFLMAASYHYIPFHNIDFEKAVFKLNQELNFKSSMLWMKGNRKDSLPKRNGFYLLLENKIKFLTENLDFSKIEDHLLNLETGEMLSDKNREKISIETIKIKEITLDKSGIISNSMHAMWISASARDFVEGVVLVEG